MASGKKRREPQDVQPVTHGGLSHEAPRPGALFGYDQDGGFITARDVTTKALVWSQRIYVVDYGDHIESDKQDVFVKSLTLSEDGYALLLVNERGERYRVWLADRSVQRVE